MKKILIILVLTIIVWTYWQKSDPPINTQLSASAKTEANISVRAEDRPNHRSTKKLISDTIEDLPLKPEDLRTEERPPEPEHEKLQFAEPIPDRPGFVINPFTRNLVDVRGIPPGSIVIDPADPDKSVNRFRVPLE